MVRKSMLPVSVCCTVFGFYTNHVRSERLQRTLVAYCWLLTVLFTTNSAAYTVSKLTTIQYNAVHVAYELLQIVHIVMLTFYRVKYCVHADTLSDVYKNIECADKSLERVGVRVSRKKERAECATFLVVVIAVVSIRTLYAVSNGRSHHSYDSLRSVHSKWNFFVKYALTYSRNMILAQLILLLYTVKKRLVFLGQAIKGGEKYFGIRIAWVGAVTVYTSIGRTPSNDKNAYYQEIKRISTYINNAFCNIKKFYQQLFCFLVVLWILAVSVTLFYSLMERDVLYFLYFTAWNTLLNVLPVILCISIRREFVTVQNLLHQVYWSNNTGRGNPNSRNANRVLLRCANMDWTFDCRYFKADVRVLSVLFDFVALLVFAMLH